MFCRILLLSALLFLSFTHVRADLPLGIEWALDSLIARIQGKKYHPQYELVIVESPEEIIGRRLRTFFERYAVDGDIINATAPRLVTQLVEQFGENVVHIQERDFFPFLFYLFNIPGVDHAALTDRVLEFQNAQYGEANYVEALVRALFELEGGVLHGGSVNDFVQRIRQGESMLHVYWASCFRSQGFNGTQAGTALRRMIHLVVRGVQVNYAYQNAFYFVCYLQDGLAPDRAIRASRVYVGSFESLEPDATLYFRTLYEAYGFPRGVARTAADVLGVLSRKYPNAGRETCIWWALFRVLGVSEGNLDMVYNTFWDRWSQGFLPMRAFEYAYVDAQEEGFDIDDFFNTLDEDLSYRLDFTQGFERFLDLLWEERFPRVAVEDRMAALDAFLRQPSSLLGILSALRESNQVKT